MTGLAANIQADDTHFLATELAYLMRVSTMSLQFLGNTANLNTSAYKFEMTIDRDMLSNAEIQEITNAQTDKLHPDYQPTIDERAFSDFKIDGSEKDFRQEALLQVSGSPLNYKAEQEDKKDDIENLRDAADQMNNNLQETLREQRERELRDNFGYNPETGMMKMNGKDVSKDVLDEHVKRAKADPNEYAKEEDISVDDVPLHLAFMEKYQQAIESGATPQQLKDIYDSFPPRITEKAVDSLEQDTKKELEANQKYQTQGHNIESSNELTQAEYEQKHDIADSWFDDNDFGSLAATTDDVTASNSVATINSEYNAAAQGEFLSLASTTKLDNTTDYQISDKEGIANQPIEIAFG